MAKSKQPHGTPRPMGLITPPTHDRWVCKPSPRAHRWKCGCGWSGEYWSWIDHTDICRRDDGNKN